MSVSRALRNLLKVRGLEEEQYKGALESALAELRALETALGAALSRRRAARCSAAAQIEAGDGLGRRAAELELDAESRRATVLAARLPAFAARVVEARELYLGKRTERRQAESLVDAAAQRDELEGDRRLQRSVDDWFNTRHAPRDRGES